MEKERRLAAEGAVENLKILVSELQNELRSKKLPVLQSDPSSVIELEQTVVEMQSENKKLLEENSSLRTKLDNADKDNESANYKIEKLKEECRLAVAKAHRIDREARFQSDVKTEMSRLRLTPDKQRVLVEIDPAEDKKSEESFPAAEVYDMIQKQADAIQKERELYRDLLSEHDDLLALLAQHDIERKGLHEALAREAGQAAVDAVIQESEKVAVQQLGSCVRLP